MQQHIYYIKFALRFAARLILLLISVCPSAKAAEKYG